VICRMVSLNLQQHLAVPAVRGYTSFYASHIV
jgi:hypothetical protein